MNKIKLIEEKVRDLIADCHEHNMQYVISIMDRDKGDTINTIEGSGGAAIIMMGLFVQKIAESTGATVDEIVDHVKKAAEAAIEVEKEENV